MAEPLGLRQQQKQSRSERILEAALSVFSRKGYHGSAVDEIADVSEVSKGGVYNYFPSKQALFLALLDRMAGLFLGRVEAALKDEPDPIARADIALQVVLQTFASHRTLSRLFFVEALGAGPEFTQRLASIRQQFADLIQRHLDEAVAQGAIPPLDTAVTARVWFGALNQVVTDWVLADPSASLEASYPTLRAVLLRGIGAEVPVEAATSTSTRPQPMPTRGSEPSAAPDLAGRLSPLLKQAIERARKLGSPVLASLSQPIPTHEPLAFFAAAEGSRFFWNRPRTGFALAGVGVAVGLTQPLAAEWQSLLADAVVESEDAIGTGPLAFGGLAFDPSRPASELWADFGPAAFTLPSYLLTCTDGTTWLTVNRLVDAEDNAQLLAHELAARLARLLSTPLPVPALTDVPLRAAEEPTRSGWTQAVLGAREAIRKEACEKVVLARHVTLKLEQPGDIAGALQRLRTDYPGCFVYAVARGDSVFLGATPERLVRLREGVVTTMCLAGSTRRGIDDAEDRALGLALLHNPKERAEHEFVVRGLREALVDVCDDLAPVSTPVLLKVKNVQHLLTTVVGRIREGLTVLDVVSRLHPTPAVGGYPRQTALQMIRKLEPFDRGWYAGPIGWFDAHGEGELAVALRCALIGPVGAHLFAGCGVVLQSDPDAEYAESELKLRPMLNALGALP
jgi:isochorismate synthase